MTLKATFLAFCASRPALAADYLTLLAKEPDRSLHSLVNDVGSLPKAAPQAFADLLRAALITSAKRRPSNPYGRNDKDRGEPRWRTAVWGFAGKALRIPASGSWRVGRAGIHPNSNSVVARIADLAPSSPNREGTWAQTSRSRKSRREGTVDVLHDTDRAGDVQCVVRSLDRMVSSVHTSTAGP